MKIREYSSKFSFCNFDGDPIREQEVMRYLKSKKYVGIYRHGVWVGGFSCWSGKLHTYEDIGPVEIDITGMTLEEMLASLKRSVWFNE